jgi:hypothetical protein
VCGVKKIVHGSAGRITMLRIDVTGIFKKPLLQLIANHLFAIVEANNVSILVHLIHTVLAR